MTSPSAFSMASSSRSSLNMSSPSNMLHEELTLKVRSKLKAEKVNLWDPPFTKPGGVRGDEETQTLAERYSRELALDIESVSTILEELRVHSLEKLAANQKFSEKGLASLKVKLTGNVPAEVVDHTVSVETSLFVSGQDLKQLISQQAGVSRGMLKLISGGKVIDDFSILKEQGVRQFGRVMAICMSETEQEARRQQEQEHEQAQRIQQTREAAQLLSDRDEVDDNSNYYLQVADQSGKPLNLPKAERKALTFAMTLHEKGRAAIKKKEYGEALVLLLEADAEFKKCRADIMQCVDNYALLCLDIVWCYLCLRNVSDLPDAQRKLDTCDECFRRSYGPNLERLQLVKGGTGTEKALFLRLHLLQGILAFHQHRREEAAALLDRAEKELRALQIDDSLISQVMDMGFTSQEARLGLRLTEGNVPLAVAHIMNRRQEREEIRTKEKERVRQAKLAKKLGKTADGNSVNVEYYESLKSMGFPKGAAAEALRQSNNDITLALEVLNTQPHLLNLPDPEAKPFDVTDDLVAQVMAVGFSSQAARAALQHTQCLERAVEELVHRQGIIPQEWLDALRAEPSPQPGSSRRKSNAEIEREKKLIASVIEDLPQGEEDHLDISLREEEQFLMEYKAYLVSSSM